MSKLSSHRRNEMKDYEFALPSKRKFPIPDKSHARAALRDVPKAEHAGSITKSEGAEVRRKAEKKLHS